MGPILSVPYRHRTLGPNGEVLTDVGHTRFLPSILDIEGEVRPEIRYRGIYEVALYDLGLRWTGEFERPDLGIWKIPPEDVLWDEAVLVVGIRISGVSNRPWSHAGVRRRRASSPALARLPFAAAGSTPGYLISRARIEARGSPSRSSFVSMEAGRSFSRLWGKRHG